MMYISEKRNGIYTESRTEGIRFEMECDTLICGLGTAGASAALFCAENGLSVIGTEELSCVGGMTTAGGICHHYFGIQSGRFLKSDAAVKEYTEKYTSHDTESKKIVFEQMIIQNGGKILYESRICGIFKENGCVKGAKIISRSGITNIACKVLIDCTGNGEISEMAGAKTEYGRKCDGLAQPYTLVSMILNSDKSVAFTNIDCGRVNENDDDELTSAIIFSNTYEPEEKRQQGSFVKNMSLLGVREGKRIVAEETVKLNDLLQGRATDKPCFYSYSDLDKHGWDIAFDGSEIGDWAVGANLGAYNVVIPIPYKALLPSGVDGLITACRAVGVDRDISSAVRMITDMKKLAEVAADIAYLSVKNGCDPKKIEYSGLKAMLEKSGCLSNPFSARFRVDGFRDWDGTRIKPHDVSLLTDSETIKQGLSSDKPGMAIFSSAMQNAVFNGELKSWLMSDNEKLRKHSAFALAFSGDLSCLEILREMLTETDNFVLKDCRKNNQTHLCMAEYWLGRLEDEKSADLLIELLSYDSDADSEATIRYKVHGFNSIKFQTISQAAAALIRIGNAHTSAREKISEAFRQAFGDEKFVKKITDKPIESAEGAMTLNIKNVTFSAIYRWKSGKAANI